MIVKVIKNQADEESAAVVMVSLIKKKQIHLMMTPIFLEILFIYKLQVVFWCCWSLCRHPYQMECLVLCFVVYRTWQVERKNCPQQA
jgi:hypothetical protein